MEEIQKKEIKYKIKQHKQMYIMPFAIYPKHLKHQIHENSSWYKKN